MEGQNAIGGVGPGYSGPEKYASDESEIMRRLLDFGGYAVVMAWHESDAEAILERGQLWYGDRIIMQKGEPSQCHTNSAMLWEANKSRTLEGPYREELALATGYAMSEDGLWRQHSWCVLRTPCAGQGRGDHSAESRLLRLCDDTRRGRTVCRAKCLKAK